MTLNNARNLSPGQILRLTNNENYRVVTSNGNKVELDVGDLFEVVEVNNDSDNFPVLKIIILKDGCEVDGFSSEGFTRNVEPISKEEFKKIISEREAEVEKNEKKICDINEEIKALINH